MGLLTLLFALGETISDTIREKAEIRRAIEEQRRYEDIDFNNIDYVRFDGTETAYRIETEEEFDPVATNFLTEQDGWQHYETKTVEYEVEDGLNYCFTIRYKNGIEIYRKFHESSWLTEQLLGYCNKRDVANANYDIAEDVNAVIESVGKMFSQSGGHDYKQAFSNFKQMQSLYNLTKISKQEEFEKAAEIKMTSLIMSDDASFNLSIYELMLYLLSTEEDGDILEKTAKDGFSFLQPTDNGIDAFAILPKGTDIDNSLVMEYNKSRIRNDFRKVIILTTGTNMSNVSNSDIVVWDLKKICAAYISAFKKVVTEENIPNKTALSKQRKERYAVIDFETTGLDYNFHNADHDEIISVAIIDQDENVVLNTYCNTVKKQSWDEAERINGISPSDVKDYPTFVEILPKVIEILLSYDHVIAYNAKFERAFLFNYALNYMNGDQSALRIHWGNDPMEMYKEYMNSPKYLKLTDAAEHFGYKFKAHDALEDVKATLHVYNALIDKI